MNTALAMTDIRLLIKRNLFLDVGRLVAALAYKVSIPELLRASVCGLKPIEIVFLNPSLKAGVIVRVSWENRQIVSDGGRVELWS